MSMQTRASSKRKNQDVLDDTSETSKQKKTHVCEEKECSICYEKLENKNYSVTKCNHIFCNDCFLESLIRNKTCPCCRTEIFDVKKNKKIMSVQDNLRLSSVNMKSSINYYCDYMIKAVHHTLKKSIAHKCACKNEECDYSCNLEESNIEKTMSDLDIVFKKKLFSSLIRQNICKLMVEVSYHQNILTENWLEQ